MRNFIGGISVKSAFIIAGWSIICTVAIITIVMFAHESSTREMRTKIDELTVMLECKNNGCDRFKGADARAMESRLESKIDMVRECCECQPKE